MDTNRNQKNEKCNVCGGRGQVLGYGRGEPKPEQCWACAPVIPITDAPSKRNS